MNKKPSSARHKLFNHLECKKNEKNIHSISYINVIETIW